jgi:hypothetical protein
MACFLIQCDALFHICKNYLLSILWQRFQNQISWQHVHALEVFGIFGFMNFLSRSESLTRKSGQDYFLLLISSSLTHTNCQQNRGRIHQHSGQKTLSIDHGIYALSILGTQHNTTGTQ